MSNKKTSVNEAAPKTVTSSNGNGSTHKKNNRKPAKLFNRAQTDKKIELIRKRFNDTVWLAFEKAAAHHENPSMYPLPASGRSIEGAFCNLINVLPSAKRKKLMDKINETLKASPAVRTAKYKDIVNVNFRSTLPIVEQVKLIPLPQEMLLNEVESNGLLEDYRRKAEKPKKTGYATSAPQPGQVVESANNVSFSVDTMTCLNPDDVLKDEVSIAGFAVDTAGNNTELAPLFVGKFRKNETVLLGDKSKLFTLPVDSNVDVQSFVAGLFIIESDLIANPEVVNNLAIVLASIALALMLFLVVVTLLPAAIMSLTAFLILGGSALTLGFIAQNIIPLLGDDISLAVTDTLAFEGKIDAGTTFERTLTIGKGFDAFSTFDGKYTAAARWVGEV